MIGISPYVFNTFILLLFAVIVMWMCAGFTMLEAGSVSARNASTICLKNVGLYAVASLAYYVLGYNLMYVDVDRWAGTFAIPYEIDPTEAVLLAGGNETAPPPTADYASGADWFFQMVFVATTASILSGAIAERVKLWVFMIFVAVLCGLIYPLVGAWTWGGGWLQAMGFQDFAGGTVVHSTGGWAALAGVLVMGPREGRFPKGRPQQRIPASNVPLATLGIFILWMGWFGFNAGSQLRFAEPAEAVRVSVVLINTNLAAASGLVAAFLVSRVVLRRTELLGILNGAIAGLVASAAGPDFIDHRLALVVGLGAGTVCTLGMAILERMGVDDVVGAVPAHLAAGVWGSMIVCLTTDAQPVVQLIGVASVGVFVFMASTATWILLEWTVGVRVSHAVETAGQDATELGVAAYPDFVPAARAGVAEHDHA